MFNYINSTDPGNILLHAVIETVGALIALLLSHLLHLSKHERRGYLLWARCALISMGTLDLFHALALPRDEFVWLHSMAIFCGGLFFSLVLAPERVSRSKAAAFLPKIILFASVVIGLSSFLFSQIVPSMFSANGFTATAIWLNIIGGSLFLVASVWFVKNYLIYKRRQDDLLFAGLCLLFGAAGIIFYFSELWNTEWWIWHAIRLIAYGIAALYVINIIRQSEETLKISEERYKRLAENSPDVVYIFSNKRGGIYYSQRVSEYLGYSAEELLRNSFIWHDSIHPEDLPIVDAAIDGYYQGQAYSIEYRIKDRLGNWRWFHDRFIKNTVKENEIIIEGLASDITARKQAEEEFVKRERFLDSIIEQNPYALWISDNKGTLLRLNQACCDMLNIRKDEVIGKYNILQDNIVVDQGKLPLVQSVFEEGKTVQFYLEYDSSLLKNLLLENYKRVILEVTIAPVKDEKGITTNAIIIHNDITARKYAEDALRESEEWFSSLFENMLGAFAHCKIIFDVEERPVDFVYLKVNSSFERLTGLKDVVGKKETEIFPDVKELHPEMFEVFGRVALTGKPEVYEIDFKPLDQVFLFSVYSIEKRYCVLTFDNITVRKRAEEELRLQSEIINRMAEGVYLVRMDGIIIYTNPKFEEMFGYDPGEMSGKHVSIVNYPTGINPEEKAKEILNVLNKEGLWQGEIQNIRKDGTPFWCYASVITFTHSLYGKVLVAVHNDITERKKNEEELKHYADTQAVLLREVNHRVKNNLAIIISMLHKEEDNVKDKGLIAYHPAFADLHTRIKSLLIVHNMLSTVDWNDLNIGALCRNIISSLLHSSTLRVNLIITETDISANSDQAHYLALVLNELATNSLKYGKTLSSPAEIRIAISKEDNKIRIIYRDNGPGYPETIINGDYSPEGIGFNLINGIVSQSLRGNVSFRNENGAVTELVFPVG